MYMHMYILCIQRISLLYACVYLHLQLNACGACDSCIHTMCTYLHESNKEMVLLFKTNIVQVAIKNNYKNLKGK